MLSIIVRVVPILVVESIGRGGHPITEGLVISFLADRYILGEQGRGDGHDVITNTYPAACRKRCFSTMSAGAKLADQKTAPPPSPPNLVQHGMPQLCKLPKLLCPTAAVDWSRTFGWENRKASPLVASGGDNTPSPAPAPIPAIDKASADNSASSEAAAPFDEGLEGLALLFDEALLSIMTPTQSRNRPLLPHRTPVSWQRGTTKLPSTLDRRWKTTMGASFAPSVEPNV